jgi:mono/diheme cytochrome c family protein
MTTRIVLVVATCALALLNARAAEHRKEKVQVDLSKLPPPASQQGVTYAANIKPIFEKSCTECHGEKRAKGHLRLDSLAAVLRGGEDGKVIKPGDSAESVLVHNVAHAGDPDDYMPPPKNKAGIGPLTTEQIALVRAWIDEGAK